MRLFPIKLDSDTITVSGETFEIENVYGFTVINTGDVNAYLSYRGGGSLFTIAPGQQREFPGYSGAKWKGTMQIKFEGGLKGNVEVVKGLLDLSEELK